MSRYRLPPAWEAYGARIGADGLLYLAEWRRGFTVHELRALFFECQRARTLEREQRELKEALDAAQAAQERAERRAWWYRSQLVTESRYALIVGALGRALDPD